MNRCPCLTASVPAGFRGMGASARMPRADAVAASLGLGRVNAVGDLWSSGAEILTSLGSIAGSVVPALISQGTGSGASGSSGTIIVQQPAAQPAAKDNTLLYVALGLGSVAVMLLARKR